MLTFTINKNDAAQRADKFLLKATSAPSSLIYKAFRKKDVKVDKKWIKENYILEEGQILSIYISDEFALKRQKTDCPSDIEVIYEDSNIAVINKPKGLPSQPDAGHTDALSERFKAYLIQKGELNPNEENSFSPALCNRLDTNTQGLVIGAKNAAALREMNLAIKERKVHKFYLCKTIGVPKPLSATINSTIRKDEKTNKSKVGEGGKPISTTYRVLSHDEKSALVEVELHTGRSHQIRAQMAGIGCPLMGDGKYGGGNSQSGQSLTAYKIVFETDGELLGYLNGKAITLEGNLY